MNRTEKTLSELYPRTWGRWLRTSFVMAVVVTILTMVGLTVILIVAAAVADIRDQRKP